MNRALGANVAEGQIVLDCSPEKWGIRLTLTVAKSRSGG